MTPTIQLCDTTHIDTISRYIADSVTLQALNNSQEFYSDAFNKLQDTFGLHLTMIAIIVTLITIIVAAVQIAFFIYSEKKLKENDTRLKDIERDVNERNEELKENDTRLKDIERDVNERNEELKENDTRLKDIERDVNERNEELKENDKRFKDIEQNFNKRDKEFNEKNKKYDERVLYFFFSIAYNFATFADIASLVTFTTQEDVKNYTMDKTRKIVKNFLTATKDFFNEMSKSLCFSNNVLNWIQCISQTIIDNILEKDNLSKDNLLKEYLSQIAKPIEEIIGKLNSMENTDCNLKVKEELQRLSAFIKDK